MVGPSPQTCARNTAVLTGSAGGAQDDDLPKPEEIEIETKDIYRHDEEQAYVTLMSQEVTSINFPCEENYTIKLCVRPLTRPGPCRAGPPCTHAASVLARPSLPWSQPAALTSPAPLCAQKEIIAYHYPDEMPLGSFELLASNKARPALPLAPLLWPGLGACRAARRTGWTTPLHAPITHPSAPALCRALQIRSDEETLGDVFNGDPYYCDKAPAEDPDFDWVPRKEQVAEARPAPRHCLRAGADRGARRHRSSQTRCSCSSRSGRRSGMRIRRSTSR